MGGMSFGFSGSSTATGGNAGQGGSATGNGFNVNYGNNVSQGGAGIPTWALVGAVVLVGLWAAKKFS